jgi:hypothetical protein
VPVIYSGDIQLYINQISIAIVRIRYRDRTIIRHPVYSPEFAIDQFSERALNIMIRQCGNPNQHGEEKKTTECCLPVGKVKRIGSLPGYSEVG